ncbi:MAG: hypothetical protein ACOYN0_14790 [Phycisphaerales bacterium]
MWGFGLRKWYLDLASPAGDFAVCYRAELSLASLRVAAEAIVISPAHGQPTVTARLAAGGSPDATNEGLSLDLAAVGARARCAGGVTPVARTLLDGPAGSIRWTPLALNGAAIVQAGGIEYRGLGYAELIEMSLPPWQLPFTTLLWGRASFNDYGCAWIQWSGGQTLSLAVSTAGPDHTPSISADRVDLEDGPVHFRAGRVVRDETLGAGLLGMIPLVARAVPPAFLRTHEVRSLRPAFRGASPSSTGWAVVETVTFGRDEPR